MKRLKDPNITPPGGWRFKDPDTGLDYNRRYKNRDELFSHIRKYRAANRLQPLEKLQAIVERWICAHAAAAGACREEPKTRSVKQYIEGLTAVVRAKLASDSDRLCNQLVAEARAATCVRCPHNKFNAKQSKLEEYTDNYVQSLVGSRRTPSDDKLFSCEVCSCPLRAKVHFGQKLVEGSLTAEERVLLPAGLPGLDGLPLYCWQTNPIELEKE